MRMLRCACFDAATAGYSAEFYYNVHGRRLRSTLYPARTVLYRRRAAGYRDEGHGHRVTITGNVRPLSGRIDHDDRKPLTRWIRSQDRYSIVEAKHLLESRLNSAGADYYLYYLHALVLVRLDPIGEHSGALRSLDESLRLNPQFAPAYFQRAKLRNDAGDTSRALADLDTATRLDRTYAEPFYLIAQIDYRLGQKEQAEQARHEYTIREKEREEQQQKQLVENRLLQALQ